MLTRQSIIALGSALLLGLVAVFFANSFLSGKQSEIYSRGTTRVAVAAQALAFGTDITPDKIRFVDYPNSSIPPGAFTNAAQLIPAGTKRVALRPISISEPILADKISGLGQGASIAALLPEGMRAATVRINDVSGVAGFVQPNDSVDILITRTPPGDGNSQVTDVLLQNVHVLAIDQKDKNPDGSPKVGRTATLEVNPLDSQKLALAQQVGTLSLVLRKPGEQSNPVVETVAMSDLRYNMYGGARYPAPAVVGSFGSAIAAPVARTAVVVARPVRAAPKRAPADSGRNIEVYRGTKSDQVKVGG